jgi:hypothetical protein
MLIQALIPRRKTKDVSEVFLCSAVTIYEEREHTMLDRFYINNSQKYHLQ